MATKVLEEMKYCMHCDRETLHRKNSKQMSWLMHLFLTVITFGLWLIVWIFIVLWHMINKSATAIGNNWICSNCGAKNSLLHNLGKTIEDELAKDKTIQEESKEQIQTVQSNSEEPINHIVENPTIQEDYKQEDTTKGEIKMENKTKGKKGLNKGIIIGGAVALLIGAGIVVSTQFGSKTPKCGDEIVQAKLLTTIKDMNMKSSSFDEATWKSMNYNITDMRTLSYDDKIDAYECAANINMTAFGEKLSSPITYRVSKLDNGDMYIEMHGVEASAQNTQKEAPPTEVANGINNSEISHCTQDEKIVFSCNTGKKIVSVCASQDISPNSGYLQYRFGKLSSPEAIIPSNPQDFRSVAYGWSAKMGSGIGFGVGNFDYSIDTYEGGILTVAQDKKTVATLTCIQDGFFVDDSGDIISMLVYPENYTN